METRPAFAAPLTCVVLFLLLAAYVGAYAALLEPQTHLRMNPAGCCLPVRTAGYQAGGATAHYAFWPANSVDRLVRPSFWEGRE
jgi:hypothetical protein